MQNKFKILEEFKKKIYKPSQQNRSYFQTYYKVQCECGTILIKNKSQLKNTISCKKCSYKLKARNINHKGIGVISLSLVYRYQKQANKRNLIFDVSPEYLNFLWEKQEGKCAFSNVKLTINSGKRAMSGFTASLDRIDSSIGYIEGNLQWVHKTINKMKSNLSDKEFTTWCKLISENTPNF